MLRTNTARVLAVAAAYYVTGRLGLLQAIPPGYATAIWAPSGIALAGVLLFGARVLPGVFLGSFLVNLTTAAGGMSVAALLRSAGIAAWIGLGASLQAWAGASLVRRFVGYPAALQEPRDVTNFLVLGGPVACLINATSSVTALALMGTIQWPEYPANWATWWIGDSIGVIVVTPLILIWMGKPREAWRTRRLSVGVPLLVTLVLAVVLFVRASAWEQAALKFDFDDHSAALAARVRTTVDNYLEVLISIGSLYAATPRVDRQGFHNFTVQVLLRHPGIQALEWIPRVPASQRAAYEQAARADGYATFRITERTAGGQTVPAGPRSEYFPVYFAEPYSGNQAALGFDLASDPARREGLIRARDSGAILATGRIVLVQETGTSSGALVYLPVYAGGLPVSISTVAQRQQAFEGFALLVLRMETLMRDVLGSGPPAGIRLGLYDNSAPPGERLLWISAQPSADGSLSTDTQAQTSRFSWATDFEVGGRRWSVRTYAEPGYLAEHRAWQSWAVLTTALVFNGLLGVLLLIVTGRSLKTEAQALESAQRYEREHHLAETLQRAFLPEALPTLPGVTFDAVYEASGAEAAVGGDWYDVFRLPDGRIACSVGDVVGSGVPAAVIMGQVRQTMRAAALETSDPAAVLERASQVLRMTYDTTGMATATFGVFDPVALTFTYTAAGHPPPILATRSGVQPLASGGTPLGVGEPKAAPVRVVALPPGALLVLYTDGLVESTRNLAEGERRLLAAVQAELEAGSARPARALLERLVTVGATGDDVAVLTIAIAPQRVQALTLTLPAEPASLRQVRQAVRQLEQGLHLDTDTAFAVQVLLGEAVNNTVEHAYGAARGMFRVRIWPEGDLLRIEVADQGRWRPARPEGHGQGLNIMNSLAESIKVDRQPSGTTVRLALRLPQSTAAAVEASPPAAGDGGRIGSAAESTAIGEGAGIGGDSRGMFEIRRIAGVPVVELRGDVDMNTTTALEELLVQAAREDQRAVVVSFTKATFFDSKAIHTLFAFGRRLETNRQRLLLVIPPGRPGRRILEVAGLADEFPVFESAEEAIVSLDRG